MVAVALVALLLPACASQERPEGIVERWLLALNQGAAGEPERFAPDGFSEQVLPGWRQEEPGQLDSIEVARATEPCLRTGAVVPLRVVRMDGTTFRGIACLELGKIVQLTSEGFHDVPIVPFPSEGGPRVGDERTAGWVVAVGTGLGLVLAGEALMRLARRRRPD